jgi:OPA family glycerol-3-phosphate transporter-like MFS transporter
MLWLDLTLFGIIGFFIYPPVMLLPVMGLDFTSKKAVGTAAGFIGLFGYLGRTVQGKGIGTLAERYGWNAAFYGILASTLLGILLLSWTWNLKPRRRPRGSHDSRCAGQARCVAALKGGARMSAVVTHR